MIVPNSRAVVYAADTTDLAALDTSGQEDGDMAFIPAQANADPRYFVLAMASVAPVGANVIATSNSVGGTLAGRWLDLRYLTGGWELQTAVVTSSNESYNVAVPGTYDPIFSLAAGDFTPSTGTLLARTIITGSSTAAGVVRVRIVYNGVTIGETTASVGAGGSFAIPVEGVIEGLTAGAVTTLPITVEWTASVVTQLATASLANQKSTLVVSDINLSE